VSASPHLSPEGHVCFTTLQKKTLVDQDEVSLLLLSCSSCIWYLLRHLLSFIADASLQVPTGFALTTVSDEVEQYGNLNLIPLYRAPHGALMATAVLILFPLGAVSMRLFGILWLHGLIQLLGTCTLLAGLGLGIKMKEVIGTVSRPS
jgi:hypothetical protein